MNLGAWVAVPSPYDVTKARIGVVVAINLRKDYQVLVSYGTENQWVLIDDVIEIENGDDIRTLDRKYFDIHFTQFSEDGEGE